MNIRTNWSRRREESPQQLRSSGTRLLLQWSEMCSIQDKIKSIKHDFIIILSFSSVILRVAIHILAIGPDEG
jgi:hypothetical protein